MTSVDKNQRKIQKRDLTKGEIVPHIFRMAIPMTIGIGSIISFSLADTYFIGMLGTNELAAIGYTFPITTLLFNFIFGMAIAMSAVVSRKIGSGNMAEVRVTATIGIVMTIIISACLSIIGYFSMTPIFKGLGAGDNVMPIISDYMSIWFIGSVFLAVPVVANAAIRGMGDAFWPATVMVTVAVVNIILDPILIFGLLGAPRLEVEGAAIASLTAYIIASIMALWILIVREKIFIPFCVFKKINWSIALKPLLVIAIPVSLASIVTPIISYGYTSILSDLGDQAVAGFGVATRFEAFAMIPIMALAGGMAPLIGQNYGAGFNDRVKMALHKAIKFSLMYGLGCAIVLAILSGPLASIFSDDANVHLFVTHYLLYVPVSFIGLNVFLVVTSAMNAMERPRTALSMNLIKSFVIALPLSWILTSMYQDDGFFISIVITNVVAVIMAVYCLKTLRCFQTMKKIS